MSYRPIYVEFCRCGSRKTGNLWTIPGPNVVLPKFGRETLCPTCKEKQEEEKLLQTVPLMREQ